jgi:fluoroacetyl-CoA thioesterase
VRFRVTEADTALALGSGEIHVLGTPRLLAWFEQVTVAAARESTGLGETTVGAAVTVRHRRPSLVGALIEVRIVAQELSNRSLTFELSAHELESGADGAAGALIAEAQIRRVVVATDRFLSGAGGS